MESREADIANVRAKDSLGTHPVFGMNIRFAKDRAMVPPKDLSEHE